MPNTKKPDWENLPDSTLVDTLRITTKITDADMEIIKDRINSMRGSAYQDAMQWLHQRDFQTELHNDAYEKGLTHWKR